MKFRKELLHPHFLYINSVSLEILGTPRSAMHILGKYKHKGHIVVHKGHKTLTHV